MNAEAVYCANARCLAVRKSGTPRFIGERSSGASGRWQCQTCNQWTIVTVPEPVPA